MNTFLPTNYEVPAGGGNYMKFEEGRNIFRVLSNAIIGYEYWTIFNKPVRSRERWQSVPEDIYKDKEGKYRINHFWAFVVWNYKAKKVQILEVTQKTVQRGIKVLVDDPSWGDPKNYDITITRIGEGFDTEYTTTPNPKSSLSKEILEQYEPMNINLESLYEGGDPFGLEMEIE